MTLAFRSRVFFVLFGLTLLFFLLASFYIGFQALVQLTVIPSWGLVTYFSGGFFRVSDLPLFFVSVGIFAVAFAYQIMLLHSLRGTPYGESFFVYVMFTALAWYFIFTMLHVYVPEAYTFLQWTMILMIFWGTLYSSQHVSSERYASIALYSILVAIVIAIVVPHATEYVLRHIAYVQAYRVTMYSLEGVFALGSLLSTCLHHEYEGVYFYTDRKTAAYGLMIAASLMSPLIISIPLIWPKVLCLIFWTFGGLLITRTLYEGFLWD